MVSCQAPSILVRRVVFVQMKVEAPEHYLETRYHLQSSAGVVRSEVVCCQREAGSVPSFGAIAGRSWVWAKGLADLGHVDDDGDVHEEDEQDDGGGAEAVEVVSSAVAVVVLRGTDLEEDVGVFRSESAVLARIARLVMKNHWQQV